VAARVGEGEGEPGLLLNLAGAPRIVDACGIAGERARAADTRGERAGGGRKGLGGLLLDWACTLWSKAQPTVGSLPFSGFHFSSIFCFKIVRHLQLFCKT
jgi:hypothetical protein